ncbi:MAG: hypothetical protein H6791_00455 [Candidatus Nomurabacteria bacterium]|nr:MAG: hypothetical protein H6791_00455 [Candidatus Nomurabacteria bacterium]
MKETYLILRQLYFTSIGEPYIFVSEDELFHGRNFNTRVEEIYIVSEYFWKQNPHKYFGMEKLESLISERVEDHRSARIIFFFMEKNYLDKIIKRSCIPMPMIPPGCIAYGIDIRPMLFYSIEIDKNLRIGHIGDKEAPIVWTDEEKPRPLVGSVFFNYDSMLKYPDGIIPLYIAGPGFNDARFKVI